MPMIDHKLTARHSDRDYHLGNTDQKRWRMVPYHALRSKLFTAPILRRKQTVVSQHSATSRADNSSP